VLVRDGTIAGYVYVEPDGGFRHMLHPSDETTGIRYRLLPMIRGVISGAFTPEQARHHLALIERHLTGPDGARLMDRPPVYRGGIARHFSRAETSPFFGREIGIMYMHAHLRYAEALSRVGRAADFLKALRQAVPVGLREVVPQAEPRQTNCYFSSSDAAFLDRYAASERYDEVRAGKVPLKSGWRIYSSGPGIFIGLVASRLLGLRRSYGRTVIDPVVVPELDGMTARTKLLGRDVELGCCVSGPGAGPKRILVNGREVEFEREANPYRVGGALIGDEALEAALDRPRNVVEVEL
jgi:cellobiose phosphorylase